MKRPITLVAGTVLVSLVLAACSSGSGDGATTTVPGDATATTVVAEAGSTTAPAGDAATATTEPAPATTTTTVVEAPAITGAAVIEQTTPTSGEGPRPLLAWEPVEGTATYTVVVYTGTGAPYWSSVTDEPGIYVGGPLQIPAGRTGPNVSDGYTWVVYADDADGNLLAVSPQRPIAP